MTTQLAGAAHEEGTGAAHEEGTGAAHEEGTGAAHEEGTGAAHEEGTAEVTGEGATEVGTGTGADRRASALDVAAAVEADVIAAITRGNSLSPSRASDFMSCPLLYRFRVIDRLPETPSIDAVRGSVVHKVLEDLFDLPAADRTHERANSLLGPVWEAFLSDEPELAEMFGAETSDLATWLEQCRDLLGRYFVLEDPRRLEPAEREVHVATQLESGLTLHGYIDRVDIAPTGEVRIVDYKTGRSPGEMFEAKALFQMKFYALVVWRTRGVIPRMLQLVYLGNGEMLRYEPEERDLLATERKVEALWHAIQRAHEAREWRPNKSALCGWCDHRAICPAWGGTPPPLPAPDDEGPVDADDPAALA